MTEVLEAEEMAPEFTRAHHLSAIVSIVSKWYKIG
jgi:hypothetical protein